MFNDRFDSFFRTHDPDTYSWRFYVHFFDFFISLCTRFIFVWWHFHQINRLKEKKYNYQNTTFSTFDQRKSTFTECHDSKNRTHSFHTLHQTPTRFPTPDIYSTAHTASVSGRSGGSIPPFIVQKSSSKNQKSKNRKNRVKCLMTVTTPSFAHMIVTHIHDDFMFTFSTFWFLFAHGPFSSGGIFVK